MQQGARQGMFRKRCGLCAAEYPCGAIRMVPEDV